MNDLPARSPRRTAGVGEWLLWFAALFAATTALAAVRAQVNEAHVTLAFLLIVQGGSARAGRPLGIALAVAAFLCFDLFFLQPYGTLIVRNPLDWLVLLAFLGTSVLSAQLLYRAQAEAEVARQRAEEIDRLAALGAETLNVGRAEDALGAIVAVIRTSLDLSDCSVYGVDPATQRLALSGRSAAEAVPLANESLVQWVATEGKTAVERVDGTTGVDIPSPFINDGEPIATAFLRPLQVRGATVGVLRVARASGLRLGAARLRVLDALAYYAALGLERVRLASEADRAAALQEAHRAKDAVLASVSHDLRTPLTTIKGLAHEIASSGDERAEIIEEEADRLNAFVAQVLDLSRISSGVAVPDVQDNEAEDLLGAAAQQSAGRMKGRTLHITISNDDSLLFGRFDFSQTLRAVVNLIENAAKYSPVTEAVDVTAFRDGSWLVFSIADRGPGVPAAERERIFEPFYRASSIPDAGGTGLGLSISRGIAEAQGGSVTISDREGGGSVFSLRVPSLRVDGDLAGS